MKNIFIQPINWLKLNSTDLNNTSKITKSQAEVIVILNNMRMKTLVTRCVLVAFFGLVVFLICLFTFMDSKIEDKIIIGVIDSILAATMYPLVAHYLPARKEAKAAEERN